MSAGAGKGDAPRFNLEKFQKGYTGVDWGSDKKGNKTHTKVKITYGGWSLCNECRRVHANGPCPDWAKPKGPSKQVSAIIESCPNCGGHMHGDGFHTPRHCERVDTYGVEPDAGPLFCCPPEEVCPVCKDDSNMIKHDNGRWVCHATHRRY